jgi:hypothetical protein
MISRGTGVKVAEPMANRLRRIGMTALVLIIALFFVAAYRFLDSRGIFNLDKDVTPGICRKIAGAVSDIAVDGKAAYIAADNTLYSYSGDKLVKLPGLSKTASVRALSATHSANGAVFLRSVLAQGEGRFALALYRVNAANLEEVGRITTDRLSNPTSIAAPDADRFYVVNRTDSHTGIGRWLDDVFLLPRTHLLWFDGMKFVEVAEHLNTPSGLIVSSDSSKLYLSQDYPRLLVGMSRNDYTGAIENPSAISLPAGPSKITLAPDGRLIVAARPKAGSGQVFRVSVENGAPKTAELLFARKGEEVRAAAELPGVLLVGTDKALLACSSAQ